MSRIDMKRHNAIVDMYNRLHLTLQEIADEFGISRQRVQQILDEYGRVTREEMTVLRQNDKQRLCNIPKYKNLTNPEYSRRMSIPIYTVNKFRVYHPFRERYWDFIKKGKPDECWEWTGYKNKNNYTIICIGNKRYENLSRIIWKKFYGDIPEGHYVHRSCHNRTCYNPNHMYINTNIRG